MSVTIDGTSGASLVQDNTITPAKLTQKLTLGTAQASTSGTAIDFTGIPSWVKRITVMLNGVSLAAAGSLVVQIGSGSLSTTGYSSTISGVANAAATSVSTFSNGMAYSAVSAAATTVSGVVTLTQLSGNTWISQFTFERPADLISGFGIGSITLGGSLDRLSIVATTSSFDAGSINILYEG